MIKLKSLIVPILGAGVISASTIGIASAATSTNSSLIPRSVVRQERLTAAAQVLNTTTTNITNARKSHTLENLVKNAGLNRRSFLAKLHRQLVSDLEAKGYPKSEIDKSLRHLRHLR